MKQKTQKNKWIIHALNKGESCVHLSNLATMFRIMLMYYVNCYTFFEQPEKDWLKIVEADSPPPDEPTLFG